MGPKGIIELTEFGVSFTPQAGVDQSPSYYAASFPQKMREEYFRKWHQEHDPKPDEAVASESVSYHGPSYDDLQPHLWKFFQAVRSRQDRKSTRLNSSHTVISYA